LGIDRGSFFCYTEIHRDDTETYGDFKIKKVGKYTFYQHSLALMEGSTACDEQQENGSLVMPEPFAAKKILTII
jgi:hypothetical protein